MLNHCDGEMSALQYILESTDAGHLVQLRVHGFVPYHAMSGQGWREGNDLERKREDLERILDEFLL